MVYNVALLPSRLRTDAIEWFSAIGAIVYLPGANPYFNQEQIKRADQLIVLLDEEWLIPGRSLGSKTEAMSNLTKVIGFFKYNPMFTVGKDRFLKIPFPQMLWKEKLPTWNDYVARLAHELGFVNNFLK